MWDVKRACRDTLLILEFKGFSSQGKRKIWEVHGSFRTGADRRERVKCRGNYGAGDPGRVVSAG